MTPIIRVAGLYCKNARAIWWRNGTLPRCLRLKKTSEARLECPFRNAQGRREVLSTFLRPDSPRNVSSTSRERTSERSISSRETRDLCGARRRDAADLDSLIFRFGETCRRCRAGGPGSGQAGPTRRFGETCKQCRAEGFGSGQAGSARSVCSRMWPILICWYFGPQSPHVLLLQGSQQRGPLSSSAAGTLNQGKIKARRVR
ncbi:uncharacterized protein LOC105182430 [Harpegnathos saltator]|uniref:uncharacterized protein LOC105182430 n=1 Tax=Harpegnathos saltator TaxID=610380 RepID=UPI000DBEDB83|nr:uncharacterized protein LOC105182430 [Harpegnathos saltator]